MIPSALDNIPKATQQFRQELVQVEGAAHKWWVIWLVEQLTRSSQVSVSCQWVERNTNRLSIQMNKMALHLSRFLETNSLLKIETPILKLCTNKNVKITCLTLTKNLKWSRKQKANSIRTTERWTSSQTQAFPFSQAQNRREKKLIKWNRISMNITLLRRIISSSEEETDSSKMGGDMELQASIMLIPRIPQFFIKVKNMRRTLCKVKKKK